MTSVQPPAVRRTTVLIAAIGGGLVSLGLLLRAGQNAPPFLLILFIGWVLLPFLALAWANWRSQRWSPWVTLAVAAPSLAIYTNAVVFNATTKTPTATFLLVPVGSWLLIATVWCIVRFRRGD